MAGFTLAPQVERLREAPWSGAFRTAWIILLGTVGARWVLPAALVHPLHPLLKVAPLLPFVAKDLAHLPDAFARSRRATGARSRSPGWRRSWLDCCAWTARCATAS